MSWKGIPKKENYMPLFAEDWNLVVDALDELYRGIFGYIHGDIIPYMHGVLDLGKRDRKWRNIFAQYGYFDPLFADIIFTEILKGEKGEIKDIISQYIWSNLFKGKLGFFEHLYIDTTPIQAITGGIVSLENIYSDIFPAIDNIYTIGLPDKRFKTAYITQGFFDYIYLQGKPFLPLQYFQYITQNFQYFQYLTQYFEYFEYITQYLQYFQYFTQYFQYFEYITQFLQYFEYFQYLTQYFQYFTQYFEYFEYITQQFQYFQYITQQFQYFQYFTQYFQYFEYFEYITQYLQYLQYITQQFQYIEYFYPYIVVTAFTQYALNQLYELFGKDVKEIKTMMSQKLARELYETTSKLIDTSTDISPVKIIEPPFGYRLDIRGWYISTNSSSGEIELKFVPSMFLVGWMPVDFMKQIGNKNMFLQGYMEALFLYWSLLSQYAKILVQIDAIMKYLY